MRPSTPALNALAALACSMWGAASESAASPITRGIDIPAITGLRMDWVESTVSDKDQIREVRYRFISSGGKVRLERWSSEADGDRHKTIFIDNGTDEITYDAIRKTLFRRRSSGGSPLATDDPMPVFLLPFIFHPGMKRTAVFNRQFETVTSSTLKSSLVAMADIPDSAFRKGQDKSTLAYAYRWFPIQGTAKAVMSSISTSWNGQGQAVEQTHEIHDASSRLLRREKYIFKMHKMADGDARMAIPMMVEADIATPMTVGGREYDLSTRRISTIKSASIGDRSISDDTFALDASIADAIYDTDTGKRLR